MNRPYRRISPYVVGVLFLSVTFPAVAQNVLEEIVVTAQRLYGLALVEHLAE